jgi:Ser/Thr protein kinase RdoA (MazF antagonist)
LTKIKSAGYKMALFDQTIAVSTEKVAEVVELHWGARLGKLIKASQNHTFEAQRNETEKLVVRVTPGATAEILSRIKNEVVFVNYVASSGKVHHVCAPVASLSGEYVLQADELVVVVSGWAQGEAVDFMSYRWMTDRNIVLAWGRWLASFHAVSKQFSVDHPTVARSIQRWDEMHKGILKGSILHADDIAVMEDPLHYGVLHGDLNISNFFIDTANTLSVFDWDQTQRGWYLWDVAQSELTAYMLAEAGSVVDGCAAGESCAVRSLNGGGLREHCGRGQQKITPIYRTNGKTFDLQSEYIVCR